jgi:hypothetical protein
MMPELKVMSAWTALSGRVALMTARRSALAPVVSTAWLAVMIQVPATSDQAEDW